jgi:hypothetical protein
VIEGGFAVGIHKSVVTDFHEAGGQYVLQEASDELHDFKGESSQSVAVMVFIADEDSAVLDFEDAVIGDGDFEDIGGEVFEAGGRGRDGLGVDVPVDEPDFRGDLIEEAGFFHFIAEPSSKDFGESFDGEIEVGSGRMPAAVG